MTISAHPHTHMYLLMRVFLCAGPCEGLDCLHGVLMHGDDHQGDNHANEDIYNKLQADDLTRGKLQGPDLTIPETDGGGSEARSEAENRVQQGPCEGMDCLHGVLMHGDDELGLTHEREHTRAQHTEQRHLPRADDADPERAMHGGNDGGHVHGDDDETEVTSAPVAPNNADPETALHGEHASDDDSTAADVRGPSSNQGVHAEGQVAPSGERIQRNGADPEVMMHGHAHAHWPVENHGDTIKHDISQNIDPESALHGEGASHVHSDDEGKVERKTNTVPIGTLDPDVMIHGQEYIGKIRAEDNDEYLRWQGAAKDNDADQQLGYSIPQMSNDILNKLENMKNKYFNALWASGELAKQLEGELDDSDEENSNSEDMRHELQIMGNTAPLKDED